jgi:CRP/FNR family cyclic AMP-dependent transcriptional regulator
LSAGQSVSFPRNWTVLRQGDQDDHVLLLLSGMTKIVVHSVAGQDTLLGIRVGGEIVGEMTALEGGERMATVITCRPVRARLIRRVLLDELMLAHPALAVQIAKMISSRLRGADERCVDIVSYSPRTRLSRALVQMVVSHGFQSGSRWELDVQLTQPELGSMVGIKRRTAELQLAKLRREGLIDWGYRAIKVIDMPRLQDIADGRENPH